MKVQLYYENTLYFTHDTVSGECAFTNARVTKMMKNSGISQPGQKPVKLGEKGFYEAYKNHVDREGLENTGFRWVQDIITQPSTGPTKK